MPPTDRPAWADWPEEPWVEPHPITVRTEDWEFQSGARRFLLELGTVQYDRALAAVNACAAAGAWNVEALPELVEAARVYVDVGLFDGAEHDRAQRRLRAALARLSAEPEEPRS